MKKFSILFLFGLLPICVFSQPILHFTKQANDFAIHESSILVDPTDFTLVRKSAELLASDIEKVTGKKPTIIHQPVTEKNIIIVGSVNSLHIKKQVASNKLNLHSIQNKWEAYQIQNVSNPLPGISNALVIVGSDRRGTAFGVFELSAQMGVSPWYWWADVPVQQRAGIYINKSTIKTDAPLVKYRGIFINDEAPALSGWTKEKFGGFNHKFYEKVFELILRHKANYLWPAMWGNAFYDDDSLNIKIADDYGVVIGTSHHEPLMRAHDEWRRYGNKQKWNYDSTEKGLKEFWRKGIERATNEKIVSVGMRGDGDEPMSRETATALLERIVKDQRDIIEDVTGKPASSTPQLWALYKEVQDYYDKGMRVPDDITLLLCDDNWGNIRRLPKFGEKPRKGGYGIYYHFDYVGGPRNYKWINTNNITRVWEQMHLAWEYQARQIWIVNVGDIKPMELPISFFLEYAWNPTRIQANDIPDYHKRWAAQQFGTKHASEIGKLLFEYGQLSSRRKPELVSPETFSITNYEEWERVVSKEWFGLTNRVIALQKKSLPSNYHSTYFQLLAHPVKAFNNLLNLYFEVAMNRLYAASKNVIANAHADNAKKYYELDSLITIDYHQLENGKWNHMMDQTHIGYTNWQQPPYNKMPDVYYVSKDSAITPAEFPPSYDRIGIIKNSAEQSRPVFYEIDKYVSIEASHYSKAISSNGIRWQILPGIGRTGDGITSFPVTASAHVPAATGAQLQFEIDVTSIGEFKVMAYFSPTLNIQNTEEGLQYAIAIDNEKPQIISINKEDKNTGSGIWNKWVGENIIIKSSTHQISTPGKHTIKYWMVNSGVVLQKLVADFGGVKPSYLGPPETKN